MEIAKGGRVIGSVGEWFSIAPPKRGREHWVDGRSAKELAKAWFPFSGTASVPREIKILLNSSNVLGAIKLIDAEPESIVRFDAFRGEPRNCDLLARGQSDLGTVVVSIEGKADEPFGKLIGEEFDAGVARSGSKLPDRMRLLTMGILGRTVEQSRELRYQLLHGIAGSITAAKSRGARIAIFPYAPDRSDKNSKQRKRPRSIRDGAYQW
jgi:hypothetical protein